MDDLYLDLSPYYTDPIEEEFEEFMEEHLYYIPSISNDKDWGKEPKKTQGQRGSGRKILKKRNKRPVSA
jgi:hypothetical protein